MPTNHWKLKSALAAGLLLVGSGVLANACSSDDNNNTTTGIVKPDGGETTTASGAGGAAGSDPTTGTGTAGTGAGGDDGGGTGGGTGGSDGGDPGAGGMCPANGAGTFDNAVRIPAGLLGPDGGILPL
jgi:hypothetical protein